MKLPASVEMKALYNIKMLLGLSIFSVFHDVLLDPFSDIC